MSDKNVAATQAGHTCSDTGVASVLGAFATDFNDRLPSSELVARHIAQADEFRWFAYPGRADMSTASDRSTLATFLGSLRQSGVTWHVDEVSQTSARADDMTCNFSIKLAELRANAPVSVLRKRWLARTLTARRFRLAVEDLSLLPFPRYPPVR